MKKVLFAAFLLALPVLANAEEARDGFGGGKKGGFMGQMTEEQKACIERQGCPKSEKPNFEKGEKPEKGQRPEMTDEQKAAMSAERECQQKAFETCGIQMPERPEGMPQGGLNGVKPRK
jgi:hypothetical protein